MKFILVLMALVIIANAISRQANGVGRDFQAYYKAGARVLAGEHPYFFEKRYPYKYGPATVAPFLIFQLFDYHVARWIYCILHVLAALSIPIVNLKLLTKAKVIGVNSKTFFWAMVLGFAGSLRFLDGEFQTSQISIWIYLATTIAVLLISSRHRARKYLGVAALAMVSQMKIHSTVMWFALTRRLCSKRNLLLLLPAVFLYLLPNPMWWLEWARQIKETTPLLPGAVHSINRQGFFGVAVIMLRWQEYGAGPWLLSLPFAVYAAIRLPRFSLADIAGSSPSTTLIRVMLTLMAWMLWGFMASPLPWAHTYSLLWGFIPLMWCIGTLSQRKIILAVVAGLALTPKGVIGAHYAKLFEGYQGPFFLILVLWFVLIVQSRNYGSAQDPKAPLTQ